MCKSIYNTVHKYVKDALLRDLLLDAVGVSNIMSTFHEMLRCANTTESLVERHCKIIEEHYSITEDTTRCKLILTNKNGVKMQLSRSVVYNKFQSAQCECTVEVYSTDVYKYLATCDLEQYNPFISVAGDNDHFAIIVKPFNVLKENTEDTCCKGRLCKEYLAYELGGNNEERN